MRRMLLIAVVLLLPGAARAQEAMPRTIAVSATGTVEREPNQAVVQLAVENQAPTAQGASQANAAAMTRLVGALRRAGIPSRGIRTTSYQLYPVYSEREQMRPNELPQVVGYRALNMVQVTVDTVGSVGAIIDLAIGNGANRVNSVGFQLRDARSAHLQAVREAIENARAEARAAATAAGVQLGRVLNINTSGFGPVPPPMPAFARAMEMAQAPTPIEGGTLTMQATVSVVYEIITP